MFPCSFSRSGNAIVLAIGIIAVAATLLATSSTSSVAQNQMAQQRVQQIDALAAVEAVLSRRESLVLRKAGDGTLFTWTGIDGQEPNFGLDFFGDCEVRWTIEPARSLRAADVNRVDDDLEWIGNPPPEADYTPVFPQQTNDYIYLFRIAAEATKPGTGNFETTRAQGVRYVSINQEPLFRYVIFYAPRGPKGDLELSHVDDVDIQGSVHTNGALYLGSRTLVDNWSTARGPTGRTRIGPVDFRDLNDDGLPTPGEPTNVPVKVNGVDGIFRLSKPLMFTALNSLPVQGIRPGGWSTSSAYVTDAGVAYPRDAVAGVDATELGNVQTAQIDAVNFINPYRITDASGFVTTGLGYGGTPSETARTINDRDGNRVPILGLAENGVTANDARDGSTADAPGRWRLESLSDFGGQARTNETGGRVKRLPRDLVGTEDLPARPLEAQAVQYVEIDADPTTDDHEFAQPLFRSAGGTTTDPQLSEDELGVVVEAPGRYLSLAMGAGRNMARRADGSGWDIVDDNGDPVATNTDQVGLVIRERPVPAVDLWPGTSGTVAMDSSNPSYMPYAYGKHFRPSNWPFTMIDVTDGLYPNAQNDTWGRFGLDPSLATNRNAVNTNSEWRAHRYQEGGTVIVTAAVAEGPANANHPTAPNPTYQRRPRFYADNWRFVHLRQPSFAAEAAPQPGFNVRWFSDINPTDSTTSTFYAGHASTNGTNWFNLLGTPQASYTRNASVLNPYPTAVEAPGFNRADYHSMRISAYVVPEFSEVYTFRVDGVDDGARLWLDGRLMTETDFWRNQGGAVSEVQTSFPLTAGQGYHLVLEHYENSGGEGLALRWQSASQPLELIPAGSAAVPHVGLYRMDTDMSFPGVAFEAIQTRIPVDSFTLGTRDEKAALMIRNGAAGLSPLLSGRDRYLAIGFNPQRGVFVQRRLEPAKPRPTDVSSFTYFVGAGSATQTSPIATGVVSTAGVMSVPATRQSETATFNGQTYAYSAYRRDAVVAPIGTAYNVLTNEVQNDYGTMTTQNVNTNSYTINMGDGVILTVRGGTTSGVAATASKSRVPQSRQRQRRDKHVTLEMSGHEAGFVAADDNRQIRFFNPTNTATTNSISYNWANIADYISATRIRMTYRENSNYGSWTPAATPVQNAFTVQPNWVFGNPSNAVVAEMNAQGIGGRTNWVKAPTGGYSYNSGSGVISVSDPTTTTFPTPSAPPAITANTNWNDGLARSFAINRGSTTVTLTHDVNSYVTAHGTWFPAPVTQWLPFLPAWLTNYPIVTAADTQSFAPDLWAGMGVLPGQVPVLGQVPTGVVTGGGRWTDDQPNAGAAAPAWGEQVWLRIERIPATSTFRFRYSLATAPGPGDWQSVTDQTGAEVTADLTGWDSLLAGPAVQSGNRNQPSTITFDGLRLEFNAPVAGDVNADNVIDANDWDAAGATPTPLASTRYLASQYQVFWGAYDITEDFFAYCETSPAARTVSEDWIYSPREFWSQNRRWDNGVEKDDTSLTNIINRMLWSKTTMLSLNMGSDPAGDHDAGEAGTQRAGIQGYLRSRTLEQAVAKPISGGAVPTVPAADSGPLWQRFNGLLYAARTNRYPFNPNRSTTLNGGLNPWSFDLDRGFPNRYVGSDANDYATLDPDTVGWTDFETADTNVHFLQPYTLPLAPPIKPQEFHHGVRMTNASHIWYGYNLNTLGEGRLSVVTPNQMYVHGDVNSQTNTITTPNSPTTPREKHTPMAVFGDVIHLLSNAFRIDRWQNPGITVTATGPTTTDITGNGVLANPTVFQASDTEYWTCFLTHNTPTTRHSVREGQGAAFVDTMMFMENWTGREMRYVGSLVVLDSRRYTRAFLMDSPKAIGRTVMGNTISGALSIDDRAAWATIHGPAEWSDQAPLGYNPPERLYEFNDDLLLQEGTPPFTPFGLTVSGLGGWSRIIQ